MENNLKNSIPFNALWWSWKPEIKNTANLIFRDISFEYRCKLKIKRLKNHLKVILTNLLVAYETDPTMNVAINMDRNRYYATKRYSLIYLRYKYIKFVMDHLIQQGYVEFHKGVHYPNYSKCARMRATSKLLRLFKNFHGENGKTIRLSIPVILRNDKKKDIDFDYNSEAARNAIRNVNKINKVLLSHKIEIDEWQLKYDKDLQEALNKYKGCEKYTRIFNNSSFDDGGRFYRHWSQGIPSNARCHILIDDEKTVELDYSCLHIYMLYCLENQKPPAGDLYKLKGINENFRDLIKIAVNIALNSSNERTAKQAINKEIKERIKYDPNLFYPKPTQILESLKNTHPIIEKYLCSGMGIKLQNLDSQIAENILLYFAERDICCLCIHDSFIVREKDKLLLEELMKRFFIEKFHYEPRISQKYFSFSPAFESESEIDNRIDNAA